MQPRFLEIFDSIGRQFRRFVLVHHSPPTVYGVDEPTLDIAGDRWKYKVGRKGASYGSIPRPESSSPCDTNGLILAVAVGRTAVVMRRP